MENTKEILRREMDMIKNISVKKGTPLTDEEIAGKLDIPVHRLFAYLNGEDPIPADLPSRLRAAYNIRQFVVRSSTRHRFRRPENDGLTRPERDADLMNRHRMESNRHDFQQTVLLIRNIGLSVGRNITVAEMAGQIGVPEEVVYAYLNNEMDMPQQEVTEKIGLVYKDLLDDLRTVEIIEELDIIKRRHSSPG